MDFKGIDSREKCSVLSYEGIRHALTMKRERILQFISFLRQKLRFLNCHLYFIMAYYKKTKYLFTLQFDLHFFKVGTYGLTFKKLLGGYTVFAAILI